eukprot:5024529-Amphidinium_carterae.1
MEKQPSSRKHPERPAPGRMSSASLHDSLSESPSPCYTKLVRHGSACVESASSKECSDRSKRLVLTWLAIRQP